jgi:acyl-coenzyme A thioesterase PaaI-like protein
MNRLERTVTRFQHYPTWLLSWVIGRVVPFTGTAGLQYERMTKQEVIISCANRRKVRNHIGQIHAAAMVLLAETATGMVVGMNIPDDKIPLIKYLRTDFVRRSQGAMRAVATLTADQVQQILREEKGEVLVPVTITDESGEEPIKCEMCWAWIPKKRS